MLLNKLIYQINQLFCKHEYETITNLYGDIINQSGGNRSVVKCIWCEKLKFNPYLDKNCKEINNF